MIKITILCTDKTHKIYPYLEKWIRENSHLYNISLIAKPSDIIGGDFLFLISCLEVINIDIRNKFRHTLVIHESDLPKGRGWSPLVWQIINDCNTIAVTIFNAEDKIDSGNVWRKEYIHLVGHELTDEINRIVFLKKIELMEYAINNYSSVTPSIQHGSPTFYNRRTPKDSELFIDKTIKEQFNLMRISDSERYPCFFNYRNHKYKLTIEKMTVPTDSKIVLGWVEK